MPDSFSRYINPALGPLFQRLGLEQEMVRGEGASLFDLEGRRYLDLSASYGALPFGHAHPALTKVARDFLAAGTPLLVKGRTNHAAGMAGERLCKRFQARQVIFSNSGAEAVNVALKVARTATGRRKILALEGAYHGTTGEALVVTGNDAFREAFSAPEGEVVFAPYGDPEELKRIYQEHRLELAAVLVEPVQGEAGVRLVGAEILRDLQQHCSEDQVWLVVDEIQTGLGRSGEASLALAWGVKPDLLLLSKGLGGGLVPVGATLAYRPLPASMNELHSSTFAANALAMALVEKVLELLDEDFLTGVRQRGQQLAEALHRLAGDFPELVVEARFQGLMGGLELVADTPTESFVLRQFLENYGLVPPGVCHAYFHHRVCLATTLNSRNTLRLSPPLVIEEKDLKQGLDAVRGYLHDLQEGRVERIGAFLADRVLPCDLGALRRSQLTRRRREFSARSQSTVPRRRVAFLVHANTAHYLDHFDPAIAALPKDKLDILARNLQAAIEPVPWHRFPLKEMEVTIFASPFLASELPRTGRKAWQHEVDLMVLAARRWGAELVGLGGLLSVVTRDGRSVEKEIPVTTGNSLTTWAAFQGVLETQRRHHPDQRPMVVILGGYGNIGRALAALALEEGFPVQLLGNPRNPQRSLLLERAVHWLSQATGAGDQLSVGTDLGEAAGAAQIVVCCTSDPDFHLDLSQLPEGSAVLDLAIPPDLGRPEDQALASLRGLHLYRAGLLRPPASIPNLKILELPEGLVYGCLAETLTLGLAGHFESFSLGDLESQKVREVGRMAAEQGFEVRIQAI
jgi:acetylornithine/succinyldiaminopimelate/putrescine aminotransferase/predicted amino acid dehydrogenase